MITRSQKNKQQCSVQIVRQRLEPIYPHATLIKHPSNQLSDPPLSDLPELLESRGRKRRRAPEPDHDRLTKRLSNQTPAPAVDSALLPSFTPLTKKHLDELERLQGMAASNNIGRAAMPTGRGGNKRSLSRYSSTADMNQETLSNSSQRTSTLANYRWKNLDNANIVVEAMDIPTNIERLVDAIIQPDLSPFRQNELASIAGTLCTDFSIVMNGAGREDDYLDLIHTALTAMDKGQRFLFPRKADWNPSLKPSSQRKILQLKTPNNNPGASISQNVAVPQQEEGLGAQALHMSPANSGSTMPPPALPPPTKPDNSGVKTPRPDITAGIRRSLLIDALKSKGLGEFQAENFLKDLQNQQVLCSNPLQPVFPLCFPPLVVEGKSYSTGKTIFEAQNQAAVSGPCMMNLQHMLSELIELNCMEQPLPERNEPLAFSICSEGPILQLWVHYTTFKDKVRIHNMNILKICHASRRPSLREEVRNFLVAVDGVMEWACSDFLEEVAKQLVLLYEAVHP